MGKHNRSVQVAVYGAPCAIPPRNTSSSNSTQETNRQRRAIVFSQTEKTQAYGVH